MLRVGIVTREWPPEVYGGAGVHVTELVRALRPLAEVSVRCFGAQRPGATAYPVPAGFGDSNPALQTLAVDLEIARDIGQVDVVHSHTWYANLAGHVAGLLAGAPHVMTAHSLEPSRPWKAEQLGAGYRVSSWAERAAYADADAVIAVSDQLRGEILTTYDIDPARVHVVRNGIDTQAFRPDPRTDLLAEQGVDPDRPYVLFVGRITRQKGIVHLLRAADRFDPSLQLVLCAAAPDTPEIGAETATLVAGLEHSRGGGVVWIREHTPRPVLQQLLTHALAFLCPSVYEPLGIVNLEAMACETAVVASDVGGIPEVVLDGETGVLVPYDAAEPRAYEHAFADAVNTLAADPQRAHVLGARGRARAVESFGWDAVAQRTVEVYRAALAARG